jgi:hypothetical protein
LHHVFYPNGNAEKISWIIQTDKSKAEQSRVHAEMYKDKVTNIQSKYIALHVGLFWGIGVFIIKNKDSIKIMLDEKTMYDQITSNSKIEDDMTSKKIHFIKQLIAQRKLEVEFELISVNDNLARKDF